MEERARRSMREVPRPSLYRPPLGPAGGPDVEEARCAVGEAGPGSCTLDALGGLPGSLWAEFTAVFQSS